MKKCPRLQLLFSTPGLLKQDTPAGGGYETGSAHPSTGSGRAGFFYAAVESQTTSYESCASLRQARGERGDTKRCFSRFFAVRGELLLSVRGAP